MAEQITHQILGPICEQDTRFSLLNVLQIMRIANCRNYGLDLKATILYFFDDDDIAHPQSLCVVGYQKKCLFLVYIGMFFTGDFIYALIIQRVYLF
jgi:hypothetical protein